MYLYTKSTRFCPNTGKQVDPIFSKVRDKFICDYTGEEINADNDEENPLYWLSIQYDHGCEPLWDEEAHRFEKDFGIEYGYFGKFLSSPYHFQHTETYGCSDVTLYLMEQWISARRKKRFKITDVFGQELKGCGTIEQVFQITRLNTLRRLLTQKIYTLEQLGFQKDML